ncbi:MAG: hypothetical protein GX621_13955 [Pirellulaceae bacterium]|nr:hypothetical protein [Pirellulaceae bacterium]
MIELGYMAKRIIARPDWLNVPTVKDICSVCGCMSMDFCDYTPFWKHNGFWFFDSPSAIRAVAWEHNVDLIDTALFYFRGYERQFDADNGKWIDYGPEQGMRTEIAPPLSAELLGYDIVTCSMQNAPEHSPLSCNHVAAHVRVNDHCLVDSLDYAVEQVETGAFSNAEPGPFRIIAVHALPWVDGR